MTHRLSTFISLVALLISTNLWAGVGEESYRKTLNSIHAIYAPLASSMGGELVVDWQWHSPNIGASARREGEIWRIFVHGGLARQPAITEDALALIACYTVGLHLGGAPMSSGWWSNPNQADYFATLKCLRRHFKDDDNEGIVARMPVPRLVKEECEKSFQSLSDAAVCVRSSMAAHSVLTFLSLLDQYNPRPQPIPSFYTPSPSVAAQTLEGLTSSLQCRLDNYFQGALCNVDWERDLSSSDERQGACHPSLGHRVGARPLCWHRP